jgi:hypothetical protein
MVRTVWMPAVAAIVLAVGGVAYGELVTVDADSYAVGADISDVFPYMTLAALGSFSGLDGRVYARAASEAELASTGSNVFGNNAEGLDGHNRPRNETWILPHAMLGVQFHRPAKYVSIDVISDDDNDVAALDVYDGDGTLLASPVTPELPYGEVGHFEVYWSDFEISYLVVSGIQGSAVHIDNLEAEVIPEPGTVFLLGVGVLGLLRRRA